MYTPIPLRWMLFRASRIAPLTSGDLRQARHVAGNLVESWRRGDRVALVLQALTLPLGCLAPLVGHLLYGWSMVLMVLLACVDILLLVIADLLRAVRGGRQVDDALRAALEVEDALATLRALRAPRVKRADPDGPPRRGYWVRHIELGERPARDLLVISWTAGLLPIVFATLMLVALAGGSEMFGASLTGFWSGAGVLVLLRLAPALAPRARPALAGPAPDRLPQAVLPAAMAYVAILGAMGIDALLRRVTTPMVADEIDGPLVLAWWATIGLGVGLGWLLRMGRGLALARRALATSEAEQIAQLRRFDPDPS